MYFFYTLRKKSSSYFYNISQQSVDFYCFYFKNRDLFDQQTTLFFQFLLVLFSWLFLFYWFYCIFLHFTLFCILHYQFFIVIFPKILVIWLVVECCIFILILLFELLVFFSLSFSFFYFNFFFFF